MFFLVFPNLKGKPQPAEVVLKLDSPNFEPRSQSKKLKVPPKHDSEICTFLLTPLLVGELIVNLELLVDDRIVVSRSIRTRAVPEGEPISSEKVRVVVCLPLVMLVERESLSRKAALESIPPREMSIPTSISPSSARPAPKPTSLTGRIGAALGVLVFIAIAAFFYVHRQHGPKVVVKPPDKTQQDVKDHGQFSPPYNTEQEKLDDAKRLREEDERMLKARRSPNDTEALAVKPPDKTQQDVKQNDDEKLRGEIEEFLEELEGKIEAALSRNGTDALDADRLSTALSNKSISELREKMREREMTEGDLDPTTKKLSRTFHIKSLRISADRKTADVTGTYEGKIISEGKEFPSAGKFKMKLSKRDGKWYIDKATF
jgi:hypothetical protein